jgi:ornithine--oxo-acid transaminase
MFGQMLVMRLFNKHNILSQICGNNFLVLKVAPPLVVTQEHLEYYVDAIEEVVRTVHMSSKFWSEALQLAQRALAV